jgi:hypothetical protein
MRNASSAIPKAIAQPATNLFLDQFSLHASCEALQQSSPPNPRGMKIPSGYFNSAPVADVLRIGVKPITAYLIEQSREMDAASLPEVKLERPRYRSRDLTEIRFEDAEQGDVGGAVATVSASRLTESCARACDSSRFAEEAGLSAGQSLASVCDCCSRS